MTSRFLQAKEEHWGTPVPPGRKHGRESYTAKIYGCDCKLCLPSGRRRADRGQGVDHATRQKKLRANKKGTPVPAGTKHGIYTYKTYGCRCDICVQTNRRRNRHQKSWAWLENATGHYAFDAKVTVIHWPPVGRGIWTCPDCGMQLRHRAPKERTIAA